MSQVDNVFKGSIQIEDRHGRDIRFCEYIQDRVLLKGWLVIINRSNQVKTGLYGYRPEQFSIDTLKSIDVWGKLPESKRTAMENGILKAQQDISDKMSHARKGRRAKSEYAHIPREITCACGRTDKIAPGVFIKKALLLCEDSDLEQKKIQGFIAAYKCPECSPRRRGRERNPLYKDIPRSVPCSDCGKDCAINAKNLYELTKGDKTAIDEYCTKYLCRSCNPDWGSWLKGKKGRGRKPNPENVGFPKTAKCVGPCGKDIPIVPNHIRGKAAKMGITVDELINNYRCRSCGGVIPHKKKRKKKKA